METVATHIDLLNDFDPRVREQALTSLINHAQDPDGQVASDPDIVNMHCHTFYSFNAFGHSPSSIAWLAKQNRFQVTGIVDFDVLDGVDEFLHACDAVHVRGTAGIETRVFVPEYADREINSPGEPGVCYHMGLGFASGQVPPPVSGILTDLKTRATKRNLDILARVNGHLFPVGIDFERDVSPLTPNGNPTERHMVAAYITAAERTVGNPASFWAKVLGVTLEQVTKAVADTPAFQNLVRSKLMKRGGVGYVQPESGMFPTLDSFHRLVVACGGIPCAAWLDGTTAAERDIESWFGFLIDRGVAALNIIPDRNWNIADPDTRALKVRELHRVVDVAKSLGLPLNVGTEMNSFGQKLVDDFDAPEMTPVRQEFIDGAYFVYGHTVMQRALGLGYQSEWAKSHMPARHQRNVFYTTVGHLVQPSSEALTQLSRVDTNATPDALISTVRNMFGKGETHV